jgi:DNA-directed RNA polymerase specialized sigma24 family protein
VLVKGILDGDPGAFDELFEAWFPRVWAHARAAGSTPAEAERLTEAAFTDVITELPRWREGTSFGAFFFGRLRAAQRRLRRAPPSDPQDA